MLFLPFYDELNNSANSLLCRKIFFESALFKVLGFSSSDLVCKVGFELLHQ